MWIAGSPRGTVAELHATELPFDARRVHLMDAIGPTIVLGSAQPEAVVDVAAASASGWEITRRRSGGGLVALDPDQVMWVDLTIPIDDPLWDTDVHRAFRWVGEVWADALRDVGLSVEVAPLGSAEDRDLGRVVCFAGVGSGEVLLDGRKLVGISQRRTRGGARFQCLVHRRWQPERWWPLVRPGAVGAPSHPAGESTGLWCERLEGRLRDGVAVVDHIGVDPATLLERLVERLPRR